MSIRKLARAQAGDTLIEVLLAFAIFGAAAITITRAMNESLNQMFVHGQQSQVQAQMRGQLAIIQAAHDAEVRDPNSRIWDDIVIRIANDVSGSTINREKAVDADGCTYSESKNRLFFLTGDGGTWTAPSFVTTPTPGPAPAETITPRPNGNSMWIEGRYVRHGAVVDGRTNTGRGYYDFYAKACWSDGRLERQQKTVMRLYDFVKTPTEVNN